MSEPTIIVAAWLPTDPPRPCPEIMTAEEAESVALAPLRKEHLTT